MDEFLAFLFWDSSFFFFPWVFLLDVSFVDALVSVWASSSSFLNLVLFWVVEPGGRLVAEGVVVWLHPQTWVSGIGEACSL
ncbi:MAG: hypothetical protein CMB67_00385 [Euryarchaeota archaeon]|nr:hypothetical protein [Euryarchaeota archaeon]